MEYSHMEQIPALVSEKYITDQYVYRQHKFITRKIKKMVFYDEGNFENIKLFYHFY